MKIRPMKGFTLIEVMIVMAVLGILAAIAIPSYNNHMRTARRATAQGCLTEMAQLMERTYATAMSYASVTTPPALPCRTELGGFYDFSFSAAPTATAYTLRAAPVSGSAQAGDVCGTMTLSHTGAKTPTTPADCWR